MSASKLDPSNCSLWFSEAEIPNLVGTTTPTDAPSASPPQVNTLAATSLSTNPLSFLIIGDTPFAEITASALEEVLETVPSLDPPFDTVWLLAPVPTTDSLPSPRSIAVKLLVELKVLSDERNVLSSATTSKAEVLPASIV